MAVTDIEKFYKAFPTLSHKRNRFPWEKEINFNMKMGEITPICVIRVNPGETFNLDLSTVMKVAPLKEPPMDCAVFKAFAFWNPDRNTWNNYKYWFGEKQKPENPEEEPTYLVPKVQLPKGGFAFNSFYDNIGCPPEVGGYKIDAYIPRTDRMIYNRYFRNQSLEDPLEVNKGDQDDDPNQNMALRKICKPRDFFTQALPTQSGTEQVEIPLGSYAPIIGDGMAIGVVSQKGTKAGLRTWGPENEVFAAREAYGAALNGPLGNSNPIESNNTLLGITNEVGKSGMIADLSKALGAPLEGLYQAVAYNTLQYITTKGGNRYFEKVSNVYGTVNPDGVLQEPEFLGSLSQYIDFDTVTQTSNTQGQTSGLGTRSANGYMENFGGIINKSFGEFGWIIIYGVVQMYPKYQQGVSKLMQTEDPLELFNPLFNLMGDEAIYMSELYVQDDTVVNENGEPQNNEAWGYGKRNSRILYPVNEIHGEQRSAYPQSLDTNHFAQYFGEKPVLNKEFDKTTDESFKRVLQVQEETQFICNALISGTHDIEIPLESIPQIIPDLSNYGLSQ